MVEMHIIDYKGEKALLLDTQDLLYVDANINESRFDEELALENVKTILVITNMPSHLIPMWLRRRILGKGSDRPNCYRVRFNG